MVQSPNANQSYSILLLQASITSQAFIPFIISQKTYEIMHAT